MSEHGKRERKLGLGLSKIEMEVALPAELVDRIDEVLEAMGFQTREELVIAAVRRLVDKYRSMALMEAHSEG